MKAHLKLVTVFSTVLILACSMENTAAYDNNTGEKAYCTDSELALRESPYSLFTDPDSWRLQYPSGNAQTGMYSDFVTESLKSKYFSKYTDSNGTDWIRFSLDASDQGKSPNGSSVRAELAHMADWQMTGKRSLSYTFYMTSTDFAQAKFTVGQFLQECDEKDSPLIRMEITDGKITAVVTNYKKDGRIKADGVTHKYAMGAIEPYQVVSLKIAMNKKELSLYRDNKLIVTHTFPDEVETYYYNYFKAGIYYQNKDSPKIFSEIFMKDLEVVIE